MNRCETCAKADRCFEGCTGYAPTAEEREAREAYETDKADAKRKGEWW